MADDHSLTPGEFHNVVQKQIINAVIEALSDDKLDWELIAPFADAARELCRGDFRKGARIRIHSHTPGSDGLVEAEEAFIGLSVLAQDDAEEWLSQTWWLSDVVTASGDSERVRGAAAAMRRSLERIETWLEQQPEGNSGEAD